MLVLPEPKVRVQRLFNRIAVPYARRVLPRAREETSRDARWLRPQRHERVLDLACGPGTLGLELARQTRVVYGFDLAERMVALAGRAARAQRRRNAFFAVAEGERLPVPDEWVDLVACSYSAANFPAPQQVIREMRRVARPGGRIGVLEVVGPNDPEQRRRLNRLEELRTQAPTRLLCLNDLVGSFEQENLRLLDCHVEERRRLLDDWLALGQGENNRELRRRLREEILATVKNDDLGLHLSHERGRWVFYHTVARLLWRKEAAV